MRRMKVLIKFVLSRQTSLIFGCSGQDGSLMCHSLLKKGEKVIGICRSQSNKIKNHIQLGIDKDIEVLNGDIKCYTTIEKIITTYQPEKIFNLAAQSSVGKSFSQPIDTIEGIVKGTINILEVAKNIKYNGKIFFAGSSEIFGSTKVRANIHHEQNPLSPYAIGKQTSFNLVKLYRKQHKLNCTTGVLFNHESPLRGPDFVTQKIIDGAIKSKTNKNHKIKLGNIHIKRDWGWAAEYIEAIQLITSATNIEDHVICTGKLTSLTEFIDIAYKKVNLNWQDHVIIKDSLKRENDISQNVGDPNPLKEKLKWEAKVNIDQIVTKLLEKQL